MFGDLSALFFKFKTMKIMVLVNTLQAVNSFIYSNHIEFFVKTVKTDPSIQFIFYTPYRMAIDTARNNAANIAMAQECDYLMFIDDDVMIPPDCLQTLIKADKDVIAGLVIIRGMPFNVMAFKYHSPEVLTFYNELPLLESCEKDHKVFDIECDSCHITKLEPLVPVDAVGFSCCLIKTDVLQAMEPPFFVTGTNHTEDVYFCLKMEHLEPKPSLYMHTGVICGHLLNSEPIEWGTRRRMQNFYNFGKTLDQGPVRDNMHIEKCLAKML